MVDSFIDLLSDPVFLVRLRSDVTRDCTLPEVLWHLATEDVVSFERLRAHQQHSWHAFLVQLSAIALHRVSALEPDLSVDEWARALAAAAGGCREAFYLVVAELSKPAFMQPPVPEGELSGFQEVNRNPDAIDILQVAKNHDVKRSRIAEAAPEHWVHALIALQTMEGYSGAKNHGIARMNGGYSNRPAFSAIPGLSLSDAYRRDLRILLSNRATVAAEIGFPQAGGKELLWLEPWNGKTQIGIQELDPWFLEICRRVRLVASDAGIGSRYTPTSCARIAARDLGGNVGDPWVPLKAEDASAITVQASGYHYRLLQDLLFGGDYRPSLLQQIWPEDPAGMSILGRALARGQGKTEGLHERVLPLPEKARAWLGRPEQRERLGQVARRRVTDAATLQGKVLKPALCELLQGAPEKIDIRDSRPEPWLSMFDGEVDRSFFPKLWEEMDLEPGEADRRWRTHLLRLGEETLSKAIAAAPIPVASKYRAIARSESRFRYASRKHLPVDAGEGGKA